MLKLKLQYFGHLMWRTDSFEKTLMLGNTEGGRRRGWQRMRWLDGITDSMDMSLSKLRIGDGQGGLACCSPWGCKELDRTEQLNWTELTHKPKASHHLTRMKTRKKEVDKRGHKYFCSLGNSFPSGAVVKNLPTKAGAGTGSISGRAPRGGNGNPLQYSFLGNPMDRGPGGLQFMGSQKIGYNWAQKTAKKKKKKAKMPLRFFKTIPFEGKRTQEKSLRQWRDSEKAKHSKCYFLKFQNKLL